PQEMADDVRKGVTDAAVMWGPLAGWYANHGGEKLKVVPLLEERPNTEKLIYRITMGVRQGETNWKHEINNVIAKRQGDIDAILLDYGVPLIGEDNKPITAPRRGTN